MKKFTMRCGHIAYKARWIDTIYIGGYAICDDCGEDTAQGYLVPVLNHYQCPYCFKEFEEHAKYYPEDLWFERKISEYWEKMIPLDEGW